MKFTVAFITLLSISSTWAVLARAEEPKDKREAPSGYPSSSSGQSSSSYQAPSSGHREASAISVGAGYSIGGAKPAYSFDGHGSSAGLQFSGEGLQSGHGGSIQLAPITLQPGQDLSQLMSQLQHSLGSGALSLQPLNTVAEFHESSGQQLSFPQYQQYAAPQYQQYQLAGQIVGAPSYTQGSKGLSSYGQTGPVLFNPSQQSVQQAALNYAVPSAGHTSDAGSLSFGGQQSLGGLSLGSGHSLGGASLSSGGSGYSLAGLGHSLGGAGLSFDGYNFGGAGHSLGSSGNALGGSGYSLGSLSGSGHSLGDSGLSLGSGYSLGGAGHSQGGSGHSLGGSGGYSLGGSPSGSGSLHGGSSSSSAHYKVLTNHGAPSKSAFKPSTFLGASIPSNSGLSAGHEASSFPSFGSHGAPSLSGLGSFPSFAGFGGSSKQIYPIYTKAEGSSDSAGAYSSAGHLASPPGTTYGFPTSSYSASGIHAASSSGPQYYMSSSKYPSSFGEGSSSYKSPSSSHSSLSSHSSSPKYSFGGHGPSSRYSSPKDSHGAHSETTYNTIKYSEELKPRSH